MTRVVQAYYQDHFGFGWALRATFTPEGRAGDGLPPDPAVLEDIQALGADGPWRDVEDISFLPAERAEIEEKLMEASRE